MKNVITGLSIAALLTLSSGCGSAQSKLDDHAAGFLEEAASGNELVERYDLNADGNGDLEKVFIVFKNAQGEEQKLIREKRLDLDYNGKFDMIARYDAKGQLVSESMDLDFDGKFDAENTYRDGHLVIQHLAPGFDGRVAVWNEFNEKGELIKKGRDTTTDDQFQRPNYWEYYDEQKLVRIGYDRDGDGKPEYFEDSEVLR
jgi:hypothetical protein